ncbi:MAG: sensor domain-containing diguanylate cyclase [Treponema sp.]|nr:sensor domain-containing diguanylate cyclase [Treponema sp.]
MSVVKKKKAAPRKSKTDKNVEKMFLEQTLQYEKQVFDLEQLLDIAKSFCSTLDFRNLLESIVYICMAQMHVLGAEIFVRDLITNETLYLEASRDNLSEDVLTSEKLSILPSQEEGKVKISIPLTSPINKLLLSLQRPVTLEGLRSMLNDEEKEVLASELHFLEYLSPTLIVPLVQKNHLNGVLVLQERIAVEDDTSYTEYEQNQIMSIASLASVAINNAALMEMSSTDMMTHLKLKYYFFNILNETIDTYAVTNEHFAVLMFDIDHFKIFNDTYGHECGDHVLIQVANLIKKSLRDSDVASRYGGEEFTVLLTKTGIEEAFLVAERIRTAIQDCDFVYNGNHLKITISVGVSVFDAEKNLVNSPNELVNQADKALYVSKETGRNKVTCYSPEMKSVK